VIFVTGLVIIFITVVFSHVCDRIYMVGTRRRRIAGDVAALAFGLGIGCVLVSLLIKAAEVMP
jgi:hypothetical protein